MRGRSATPPEPGLPGASVNLDPKGILGAECMREIQTIM